MLVLSHPKALTLPACPLSYLLVEAPLDVVQLQCFSWLAMCMYVVVVVVMVLKNNNNNNNNNTYLLEIRVNGREGKANYALEHTPLVEQPIITTTCHPALAALFWWNGPTTTTTIASNSPCQPKGPPLN